MGGGGEVSSFTILSNIDLIKIIYPSVTIPEKKVQVVRFEGNKVSPHTLTLKKNVLIVILLSRKKYPVVSLERTTFNQIALK